MISRRQAPGRKAAVPAVASLAVLGLLIASTGGCQARELQRPTSFAIDPTGAPTAVIGPFEVHIDPAASRLAEGQQLVLLDIVRPVLQRVAQALRSPKASIVIDVAPRRAIPEVGVGGATDAVSGNIRVSLDDARRPDIKSALTVALPRSLAHELAHSTRVLDGPGPGESLLDTFVQEGLADQFAQGLLGTPAPPWTSALTAAQAADLWARAQPVLDARDRKTKVAWLFGAAGIPKWTAYTLGTQIIVAYRDKATGMGWADLMREESQKILKASQYDPAGS